MQARMETEVWREKNRVVLHAVKMVFWQVYDIRCQVHLFIYRNCDIVMLFQQINGFFLAR